MERSGIASPCDAVVSGPLFSVLHYYPLLLSLSIMTLIPMAEQVWASQRSINNFSFATAQLFTPLLEFLRCLSHPICYFANDF